MNKRIFLLLLIVITMLTGFGCGNTAGAFLDSESTKQQSTTFDDNKEVSEEFPGGENSSAEEAFDVNENSEEALAETSEVSSQITLGFTGDINFDENWPTMTYYNTTANGLSDCIDTKLLELTKSFTLFMTNNEFTYSDRGTAISGKMYTFRAEPFRISLLEEMGTDLVLLANNHIFDYGEEAFYDTLQTLKDADIDYVGAGKNLEEATNILYYEYDSITLAYTAATKAEKNIMTPEASESSPGVLRCYDTKAYLAKIEEAAENSDFVVASIHWGTEYSNDFTSSQQQIAHDLIDAGADVIIGTHPHVLQGIEYYNGKPIFYSLGNYWFNEKTLYSCVVELDVNTKSAALESVRFYPCIQSDCQTHLACDEDAEEIYHFMEQLSPNVTIDSSGFVTQEDLPADAPSSQE